MASFIKMKTVNDLRRDMSFFIPSYQRGYRWDEQQVLNLLNDIYDFMQSDSSDFYCLQPIVVRERNGEANGKKHYEVIDGQQRLTTIKIILSYLGRSNYDITYEIRPDSEKTLNNLDSVEPQKNIDFFFFKKAYETVKNWFNAPRMDSETLEDEFHIALGKRVKVIWYEVDPTIEVREVFSRLNIGKIPLTNAELIKALILTANKDRQLEMANEWDSIERKLRDNRFWYFINPEKKYTSRIELLFDLYTKNTQNEQYDKFYTFYKIQEQADLRTVWQQIKSYLALLEEWFEDHTLYHYIGYLMQNKDIADIIDVYEHPEITDKIAFRNSLKKQIYQQIDGIDLSELQYGQDNHHIKNVLLLFNIATTLNQKNYDVRFPFDAYVDGKWSIEHIHAQNTEGLRTKELWRAWISDSIKLFDQLHDPSDAAIIQRLKGELHNQNLTQMEFDELFTMVIGSTEERFGTDLDTLDNLALLDQGTNSALGNHFYPVKYRKLLDYDKKGNFIPICTRNVFMKYYSHEVEHFQLWSVSDRSGYLEAIKKSFEIFQ
ncbi:DUF262 domain-containing protein [Peribacillus glennii]|uniref:DUF262 domain-containing protein n=1 Tax=Peribacillus glennii TaxID=2303991 RepID=A0A372L7A7_9BACI|nr:DUF262 domain-containing protein [Peribacillus glennii]RFU61108.1 DUF262 domain-containing protein [Peribacillus glennii]